jgi:rod shape determining protein RodA
MSLQRPPLWQIIKPHLTVFDGALSLIVFLILSVGIVTLYSAGMNFPAGWKTSCATSWWPSSSCGWPPTSRPSCCCAGRAGLYGGGDAAHCGGAVRHHQEGSRRWLNIGMVVQPSEIMKIAMPLMLAWYFQKREGMLRWDAFLVAAILLLIPASSSSASLTWGPVCWWWPASTSSSLPACPGRSCWGSSWPVRPACRWCGPSCTITSASAS